MYVLVLQINYMKNNMNNLKQYNEEVMKKFDEEFTSMGKTGFQHLARAEYSTPEKIKAFLLASLKGQLEVVVESMLMEGIEAKMTPFQTTVNQYIRNRGKELQKSFTTPTQDESTYEYRINK
jgi:uncharacterized protein YktB (UPF0637 family)